MTEKAANKLFNKLWLDSIILYSGLPHGDKNSPFTIEDQVEQRKKLRGGLLPGTRVPCQEMFESWKNK